jgi:integrase
MASLSRIRPRGERGQGGWRIQFSDGGGQRLSIHLGSVPKKAAETWLARVEQLVASLVTGVAWDTDLACWVRDLPDVAHKKLAKVGLVEPREPDPRQSITVGTLTRTFVERSTAKPTTILGFKQTLDALNEFFGADKTIATITAEDADRWRAWVVQDKQGSGNRRKKRTTGDNRLSPPTVAKRVSVAKQVFRCAVRWEWLEKSPFDGLRPGSQANPARACYVPVETIRDVIEACPTSDWRLIVALSRLAGLRCPSEIGSLTWASVNWEKGRLTVLAKKTEHHGGDHAMRVVPICPELRTILAEAFELAEPGTEWIVPMAARRAVNLRTHLERIIVKAGHKPWPRLMQNLRASCETDWVERFPAHVVAKWLGHSPKVAAQHYLMAREHHFEEVVGGGESASPQRGGSTPVAVDANPDAGQGGSERVRADCSSLCVQIAPQQAAAADGTLRHKMKQPAATIEVTAGSSEVTPTSKSGVMAGAGFEPATSRL